MKTPMQELISVIRKRQEDEDVQPFMWLEQIVELAESMLEKEKRHLEASYEEGYDDCNAGKLFRTEWYNETYNTRTIDDSMKNLDECIKRTGDIWKGKNSVEWVKEIRNTENE